MALDRTTYKPAFSMHVTRPARPWDASCPLEGTPCTLGEATCTLGEAPCAVGETLPRSEKRLAERRSVTGDLTTAEQSNVREALEFLHARCGTWATVAKAVRLGENTLSDAARGFRVPGPLLAFRVARLAKVGVDDVFAGRFPDPRCCPHCGHVKEEEAAQ